MWFSDAGKTGLCVRQGYVLKVRGRRRSLLLLDLTFVGRALQQGYRDQSGDGNDSRERICGDGRDARDEDGEAAENSSEAIEHEHGAAMAEAEIGKAVRGVVLARRSERDEAAAGTGDRDESGVEDRDAEDQHGNEPRGREMRRTFGTDFQAERGHQESEEHGATIAHENFRRIEIPDQETESGAESGGRQRADHRLPIERGRQREDAGGYGGDAGAEPVHVVENAE